VQTFIVLLRGVSPQTLQMAKLSACLRKAGFDDVKTVLSSGNAVFSGSEKSVPALEGRIERLLKDATGRDFHTIIRTKTEIEALLNADPFRRHEIAEGAKRVVSFSKQALKLPKGFEAKRGEARILEVKDREAFTSYVPGTEGPVFMELIADAFGREVTTRTWDTLLKCLKAAG